MQSHFAILVDTLIGFWLPAWKLKSATKQVQQGKFYFFDGGVVRALSGRLPYPPTQEERGPLVEDVHPERDPRLSRLLGPPLSSALLAKLRRRGGGRAV